MFNLDVTEVRRIAVSAVGALLVSATCILGAVGPARAAQPQTTITVAVTHSTGLVGAVRY